MHHGVILINLGTPKKADFKHVAKFLAEFLMDYRVIDLPWFIRIILVYGVIIPFRIQKTIHAYKSIWHSNGSPLMLNQINLPKLLKNKLSEKKYKIILAMRYGEPTIKDAVNKLKDCETITILPLFPQYSSAATGSALEKTLDLIKKQINFPKIKIINSFYNHPGFIKPLSLLIKKHLPSKFHLLMSFHGLPLRQLQRSCKKTCPNTATDPCLSDYLKNPDHSQCYRAQCYETAYLVAKSLALNEENFSVSFQSRLGKTTWIKPYTDEHLSKLRQLGITKLAVACPAFVADCLESLEEINIQLRLEWHKLGGEEFIAIPCLNYEEQWLKGLINIINSI